MARRPTRERATGRRRATGPSRTIRRMHDDALYESFFEDSFEAAVIVAEDGRAARMNRAAREFPLADLAALIQDRTAATSFYDEVRRHGRATLHLRLTETEGRGRHVELEGRRAGRWSVVVVRDTTERDLLNDELLRLRRGESAGYLVASLVHDFNNLLTIIACSSAALANEIGDRVPSLEILDEIQSAAGRAAKIVRQMLSPEPPQARAPQYVKVNDAIAEVRPLLERTVGPNVELSLALGVDVGEATADRDALERALLNLAANARDAMPRGGRLTIGTHAVRLGEDESAGPDRAYAAIAVSDTGIGMSREVRARIFDRFYTTKSANRGSGLGLSMVQRFVAESGGCVSVHSYPGQGTTFLLYLPSAYGPERAMTEPSLTCCLHA